MGQLHKELCWHSTGWEAGREAEGAELLLVFRMKRDPAFGDANLSLFTVSEFAYGNERKTNSRTSLRSSA